MKDKFHDDGTLRPVFIAPHASPELGEFHGQSALTDVHRREFSDSGTDTSLPRSGPQIVAEYSRALGDYSRPLNSADLFPTHDFLDIEGTRRRIWNGVLKPEERVHLLKTHYAPFHNRIRDALQSGANLVVDWHNMPEDYRLGSGTDPEALKHMPAVVLSNNGDVGKPGSSAKDIVTTCDPHLLEMIAGELIVQMKRTGLPYDVQMNTLSSRAHTDCGHISAHYNTRTNHDLSVGHPVNSFQVEFSRQISKMPKGEERLRKAFEDTLAIVKTRYKSVNN